MQAALRDQSPRQTTITIVGDDQAGALAEALRRQGPAVRMGAVTDAPESFGVGPVLAVGIAAADGGATLRRRLGPEAALIVVLPTEALSARLEAYRQGAAVVEATVAAETARSVVDRLEEGAASELGWVRTEDLLEAVSARLAARLGTGRRGGAQIRLGDGRALSDALDQFGDALAALAAGTRVLDPKPPSSPPRAATMQDLDWEDDPQTRKADLEEYRRLAESEPPRDASGVVTTARGDARAELSPPPAEQGEPAPRASMIRALRPARDADDGPAVTLASNASSIDLPALPGETDAAPTPLPPVLDPFAPGAPPGRALRRTEDPASGALEDRVPRLAGDLAERWQTVQLEPADATRIPGWFGGVLVGLVAVGAFAAWAFFAG